MNSSPWLAPRICLAATAILAALFSPVPSLRADESQPTRSDLGHLGGVSVGQAVTLPRAVQFDFTSRLNGQNYRLMVSTPARMLPGTSYPVFYVLDGYWYFHSAALNVPADPGDHLLPAIVVGLGYPTDAMSELLRRRTFDLTPPPVLGKASAGAEDGTGGVDGFIRLLLEEVRPFVQSHYPVDENRQSIFGMSNGGLAVLRLLFRHPQAFQTYIAGSPAIYHNHRAVLADEAAFSQQARAGSLHLKLLITSAGNEQYRGTDPKLLAADDRFVDDASELAARLEELDPANVQVVRTIFADESHKSVSLPALSRALQFALKP